MTKNTGNTLSSPLQQVDYGYNIRGWLKEINDVNSLGSDLFAFKIGYNEGSNALYNGNISSTSWRTNNTDNSLKSYNYTYDALNRITSGTDNTGNYNLLGIEYDKMGNIVSLQRQGHINADATLFGTMDNLMYTYNTGNKLQSVQDSGNGTYGFKDGANTTTEYLYDDNGNMIKDDNKGISNITYNHLNLPTQVSMADGTISYIYDAAGVKLKKIVNNTAESSLTSTEYAGNYIYENGNLRFFNTAEGYVEKDGNGGYDYIYQYKDHLSNIRLSYSDDDGNGSIAQSEIREENNYYPFGLKHRGYNNNQGAARDHKFEFNGQEIDQNFEMNITEMAFRQYDSALGRFIAIDAAAEMAHNWTPYRFGFNNPNVFSDPLGLWEIRDGQWYTDDAKDIGRFLNMLGFEEAFYDGASEAQIDKFIGEEFRGSGGRLSDGSILLDEETIAIDKYGKSEGFNARQIDHINSQSENYGSNWWNEGTGQSQHWAYSYKYFRERSWSQNGGSFPGLVLGSAATSAAENFLFNSESWYSFAQNKRYSHNFHGNQFTERRVTIGNFSKFLNAGGKMLGAYGLYSTYGEWQNGKLSDAGAAYIGGVDGSALGTRNPYVGAWSLGTGIGKAIVETDWYFNTFQNRINW